MSDVEDLFNLLRALANSEHDDFSVVEDAIEEIRALCGHNDWFRAELERLRAENERLRSDVQRVETILQSVRSERDYAVQHLGKVRAENERLAKEVEHWSEARCTALLAGDVLKAENERLRADAERYRCARQNGMLVIDVRGNSNSAVFPEEWDALIDAVRLGKEKVVDE